MAKESYRKQQIQKCLDCKKGKTIISEYKGFYAMIMEEEKIKELLKEMDRNSIKNSVKYSNLQILIAQSKNS